MARRWLDARGGHVALSRGRNVRESGVPQRLDRPATAKKRTRAEKPPPGRRRVTPPTRQRRTVSVTSDPATAPCSNHGRRPDTTPLRLRGVGWSGSTRVSFVRARFSPPYTITKIPPHNLYGHRVWRRVRTTIVRVCRPRNRRRRRCRLRVYSVPVASSSSSSPVTSMNRNRCGRSKITRIHTVRVI